MAGFIYYVSKGPFPLRRQVLQDVGVGHALTAGDPESRQVKRGPDGGDGVICVPQQPEGAAECMIHPDRQTWKKAPGGKWWVGFNNDARPAPRLLMRQHLMDGGAVRLRDGNDWLIPRVHAVLPDRPSGVPRVFGLDDEGKWTQTPAEEYRGVCKRAFGFFETFVRGEPFDKSEGLALACDVLALNYRVSAVEISALGLLGDVELRLILRQIIDADELEARAKKGSPAATPAT